METRSNVKLVVAVVGFLLFGLMLFIYFLSNSAGSFDALYQIRFGKSVSGLKAGSTVTMSGVPVGKITAISIDRDYPGSVLVTVALDEKLPIRQGVKADISRSLLNGDAALVLLPSAEGKLMNPAERGEIGLIASATGDKNRDPAQDAVQIARNHSLRAINGAASLQISVHNSWTETAIPEIIRRGCAHPLRATRPSVPIAPTKTAMASKPTV